jgi:hypothetical protein
MNRVGIPGVFLLGLCLFPDPLAAGVGSSQPLPRDASRVLAAEGFRELELETTPKEWAPEPLLQYEQDGSQLPLPSGARLGAAPV